MAFEMKDRLHALKHGMGVSYNSGMFIYTPHAGVQTRLRLAVYMTVLTLCPYAYRTLRSPYVLPCALGGFH